MHYDCLQYGPNVRPRERASTSKQREREQYCGIQSPASRSLCDMDRCSDEPATRWSQTQVCGLKFAGGSWFDRELSSLFGALLAWGCSRRSVGSSRGYEALEIIGRGSFGRAKINKGFDLRFQCATKLENDVCANNGILVIIRAEFRDLHELLLERACMLLGAVQVCNPGS